MGSKVQNILLVNGSSNCYSYKLVCSEGHEQNGDSGHAGGEKSKGASSLLHDFHLVGIWFSVNDSSCGGGDGVECGGCVILVDSGTHGDVISLVEIGGVATNLGNLHGEIASEVGISISGAFISSGGVSRGGNPFWVIFGLFQEVGSLGTPGDVDDKSRLWVERNGVVALQGEVVNVLVIRALGKLATNGEGGSISLVNECDPLVEDLSVNE